MTHILDLNWPQQCSLVVQARHTHLHFQLWLDWVLQIISEEESMYMSPRPMKRGAAIDAESYMGLNALMEVKSFCNYHTQVVDHDLMFPHHPLVFLYLSHFSLYRHRAFLSPHSQGSSHHHLER